MSDELPDDTPLTDLLITTRVRSCLLNGGYKTVGELRLLSDHALMTLQNFGEVALLEVRLLTGQIKPGSKGIRRVSESSLKGMWVRAIHEGRCECSFEDWKRDHAKS